MQQPTVLYEDNHLLVVDKPAGLATAGVTDAPSVYSWAQDYLKHRYNKPGNVYVGIVSRLDTVTSGVLTLARTSKSAARLSDQIRLHKIEKTYLAVVEGHLQSNDAGTWIDQLFKDDDAHRMKVVSGQYSPHQIAQLKAQTAELSIVPQQQLTIDGRSATLVTVKLKTGRKHQIRVQCSARKHAVWGDRKYGATTKELSHNAMRGIALHALNVKFSHPTKNETLSFDAPIPMTWGLFGRLPNLETVRK